MEEHIAEQDIHHRKSAAHLHQGYLKEHEGHEEMHFTMMMIFFVAIFCGQLFLVFWKTRYTRSYQALTLLAVWLTPVYYCIKLVFWRMFTCWLIFTAISMFILRRASAKPLNPDTPRLVYRWFLLVHQISLMLGLLGYSIILMLFLSLGNNRGWMDAITEAGVLFVFYGLYYGLLGRDLAEYCVDNMSSTFKYSPLSSEMEESSFDALQCYVCNQPLLPSELNSSKSPERILRISCGHKFHEFCIRGWCIVGKKHVCPFCREHVNLMELLQQPWQKPNILFGQLLDALQYLIAWFPLILLLCQFSYFLLGLS